MISKVLNHTMHAITVWLIATSILKKHQLKKHRLSIQQQITLTIYPQRQDARKKKGKKNKSKKYSQNNMLQNYHPPQTHDTHKPVEHRMMTEQEHNQRKEKVIQELTLIQNYFLQQIQQIIPYNGKRGSYKLTIDGTMKSISISWNYTDTYPFEIIDVDIYNQGLNPLELEKIDQLLEEHQEKARKNHSYLYLFNLTTSIFQDCMLVIKEICGEEDKTIQEIPSPQLQPIRIPNKIQEKQDIQTMKQFYNQIFYLHDMRQKPDASMMKQNHQQHAKIGMQNTRGRYLSQFQQIQLIGEGGFGKVYKVMHKLDGNIYAIKKIVVNLQDLNDKKILKQVSFLSKLNHPNIVRYHQSWLEDANSMQDIIQDMDFIDEEDKIQELNSVLKRWKHNLSGGIIFQAGSSEVSYNGSLAQDSGIVFQDNQDSDIAFQDDGQDMNTPSRSSISQNSYSGRHSSHSSSMMKGFDVFPFKILYIAMELCNGITLRQFINTRFDEQEQKIPILRGILQGLSYIHQKKIIHRDLKPPNIFLTQTNKVKIGDFGLAITQQKSINYSNQSHEFDPLSQKTKAVGTGFYRAPQQLKSHKYNQKVDIFSFGIIMFELFYQFKTGMQRVEVLKELTQTYELPKDFRAQKKGSDILQILVLSLKENPEERPSAAKLLQRFRNKLFTQMVSLIANPKHFQFSQLITHLFDIKNQAVPPILWRDSFKTYLTTKLQRIYHIHRATLFPTIPFVPVQDFQTLNGHRIKIPRSQKYLLLSNKGVVLEYTSNCLKTWLKYARQDFRKKKQLSIEQQKSSIRRYTFEKIVNWQPNPKYEDICFHEKMVTAFDLSYKLEEGFNAFYLYQTIKVSEAIINTLQFTQRKPPIYMFHSCIYSLLAEQYQVHKNMLFSALLSIHNPQQFQNDTIQKKKAYFQQRNLPLNLAKKLSEIMQCQFQDPFELFNKLELNRQSQLFKEIEYEINQFYTVWQRLFQQMKQQNKQSKIRWKILIPQSNCNGFFWEIATIKGLTSIQQYSTNQDFCNYHIQMLIDPEKEITDLSIWCIGDYLQPEMQRMISQCWRQGLNARWYDWQIGEREVTSSRHNIILRRRKGKVQAMIKYNQLKKGQNREERESPFINLQQFKFDLIKQIANGFYLQSYH